MAFDPGIYLDLDEKSYHADEALGSTMLKRLLISGPDFWWDSAYNPHRPPEKEKDHLTFGKAVHAMVLEGPEAFRARYMRAPDPEGLLKTDEDVKRWLDERAEELDRRGIKKLPTTKAGKVALALEIDPTVRIEDAIKAEAKARGLFVLPVDAHDRVVVASAMLAENPSFAEAFQNGYPEVSVFWDKDMGDGQPPIRCKCRFDWLKIRANADIKTITNVMDRPFRDACRRAITTYRYDISAAHYLDGRAAMAGLIAEGKIIGEHDADWFARLAAEENFAMSFVFFQSSGAPISWGTTISRANPIVDLARGDIAKAIETFREFMASYGPDRPWFLTEPLAELDINDLPPWHGRP